MSKAPQFDFTLGDKTLDDLNIRHLILSVAFEEEMGKFDSVDIEIMDGPELLTALELVQHGAALQLSIGYHNIEVLPMTVCFLKGIQPNFAERTVRIKFVSYLKAMDMHERDRSLNNRTIREVVAEVLEDYSSMKIGNIDNGELKISATTTQSKQTDFKLLEGIAEMFGMRWKVEPSDEPGVWLLSLYKMNYDKELAKTVEPIWCHPEEKAISPLKALHLKSFTPESNVLGVSSKVQIRSNNPDQPIVVDSSYEDSPLVGTTVHGSEIVANIFGVVTKVHFHENLTDDEAAQIIANQLIADDSLAFVVAKNSQLNEGNPRLRVGGVRQIYPKGIRLFEDIFEGVYFITKTRHVVDTRQGYDVYIDVAMNSLTVPAPKVHQTGWGSGGSGTPVWIRISNTGGLIGWYVSFRGDGVIVRGAPIREEEILANPYWMQHVHQSTQTLLAPETPGMLPSGFLGSVGVGGSADASPFQTEAIRRANAPGARLGGSVDVYIDFPPEWRTGVTLATPISGSGKAVANRAIQRIFTGVFGGPAVYDTSSEESEPLTAIEQRALLLRTMDAVRKVL